MIQVAACHTDNLFARGKEAISLVEQFCACPSAQKVLREISAKIVVLVGDFPHNRISFNREMEIQIPQKMMKTGEALPSLIWEIFNAKVVPRFQAIQGRAEQGHMGVNDYARRMETAEFQSKIGADGLVKTCDSFYRMKPAPGSPDLDFSLWNHEINCHTDKIRERWIDQYQKRYCKNHPNDRKSCQVKKKDLCDFYAFQKLSLSEQTFQVQTRTCEKLPGASSKIRDFFSSKYGDLKAFCVSILSKRKTEL